jgi:hypothetical protein
MKSGIPVLGIIGNCSISGFADKIFDANESLVGWAVINNYRRNSGVVGATGAPHSSQNLARGETRWRLRQRLLSSKRST